MIFLMSQNDPVRQWNPKPVPRLTQALQGKEGHIFIEHGTSIITLKCSQQDCGPESSSDSEASPSWLELPVLG